MDERIVWLTLEQAAAMTHAATLVAEHLDPPEHYLRALASGTVAMAEAFGIAKEEAPLTPDADGGE